MTKKKEKITCKKKIERLLKKNKRMYPSDISEKTGCSYSEVLRELKILEKNGFVREERD